MARVFSARTGRESSWPVLLLLLAAIVPLAGMAWMLRAALQSEQLAVRQRLADAYRVHLERAGKDVTAEWERLLAQLSTAAVEQTPAEAFQWSVTRGHADSLIVWRDDGGTAYPNAATAADMKDHEQAWLAAERLEFHELDVAGAAEAYRGIASAAADERSRALAEQALARCLLKLNNRRGAVDILERLRTLAVTDEHGRSIAADAELRLLEISDIGSARAREVAASLTNRLNGYSDSVLPADQRLFIMRRVLELAPGDAASGDPRFPTMAAEELAATFLAASSANERHTELRREVSGIWSITSADGRVTALFRQDGVEKFLSNVFNAQPVAKGVSLSTRAPGDDRADDNQLTTTALSPVMPGWRVMMLADGGQVFDEAASERRALLITIGAVMVGLTAATLWLAASGVRRQMHVARLKNDLVATVSHELKTPLASTRLLVDTLLDQEAGLTATTREYLEMISHENARLTRLIDNFLSFSRMDRGKQCFKFEPVDLRQVIARAVEAVRDRFEGGDADLEVEVAGPLWVQGDEESLVTAVINLLDNAWKYSGEQKCVIVRGIRNQGRASIEVEDNGAGLSAAAAKKVFERFYQVDQQLSRSHGGCGLGLSIVKSIVDAHGGEVRVQSVPGEGSTFSIALPAQQVGQTASAETGRSLDATVRIGRSEP